MVTSYDGHGFPPSVKLCTGQNSAEEVHDQDPRRTRVTSWLDTCPYGSALNVTNSAKDECPISSSRSGMPALSPFGYWSSWLRTGSSGDGSSV